MRTEKAVLLVCSDLDLAARIAREIGSWVERPVVGVANVEDAFALGDLHQFTLVVLYLGGAQDVCQLDALLWNGSRTGPSVPLIALSAEYDVSQALTCFRMGVTEYLGLNEHRDSVPSVIRSLLAPQNFSALKVESEKLASNWESPKARVGSRML